MNYDFGGYATRNDLTCTDGRVIKRDAFKNQNGESVPLVWMHNSRDLNNILGLAHLENRDDGVYAYCEFNDTESGVNAKKIVQHGDVRSLSIFANNLTSVGSDVIHGTIREVSLVTAGANPGAFIDDIITHADGENAMVIGYDEPIEFLEHSEKEDEKDGDSDETLEDIFNTLNEKQKTMVYAMLAMVNSGNEPEDKKDTVEHSAKDETLGDVFSTLNEKQQTMVYALLSMLSEEGDDSSMKHNVFENDLRDDSTYLSHEAQADILDIAKRSNIGSFQAAMEMYAADNALQHDALAGGFEQSGVTGVSALFPEYTDVRPGAPELITNDQGWISSVMNNVHKSPISRIRTGQVDIRNIDTLRAKGYAKGKQKKQAGNFKLVRRTTDPQTVYVKNALHRDDIIDITDFDYVSYLYNIDRMMLNEELAMAIMLGDGREDGAEDKISPEHIRPIWLDDDLYAMHVDLDLEAAKAELQGANTGLNFGENYIMAEAMINTVLYARERYKGTGTPDLYITPHNLNKMLLARDINGRRIYSSISELATALNVKNIHTVEQFEGKERKDDQSKKHKLVAIIVNLNDYSLGATKGGEITHFTQFDIDFNQQKSLLETRVSGALTRVYSAIVVEEPPVGDE